MVLITASSLLPQLLDCNSLQTLCMCVVLVCVVYKPNNKQVPLL